ncbi:hypothetical protein BFS06_12495 [Clostridium perfringens]|nr:hypothetical protein BFS06_12495 [Clostridium perfringens]
MEFVLLILKILLDFIFGSIMAKVLLFFVKRKYSSKIQIFFICLAMFFLSICLVIISRTYIFIFMLFFIILYGLVIYVKNKILKGDI